MKAMENRNWGFASSTLCVWLTMNAFALAQDSTALQAADSSAVTVAANASATDARLQQLFEDYYQQYLILFPLEATNFGDNRYNDQLTVTISTDFVAKEMSFYQQTLDRLSGIGVEQAAATPRLMAEILQYELEMRLDKLQYHFERIPFHQFDGLPLTMAQLGSGASSQPFKTVQDYDNWLSRVQVFTQQWCPIAIARFREGIADDYVLPRVLVEKMVGQMLDPTIVADAPQQSIFFGPIKKLPDSFSPHERARLTQAYQQAISQQLIPAYRQLGEFLRDEYLPQARSSTGIMALTDGAEQYAYWVRYWTTTDMTPDQIFDLGEREVARITVGIEQVKQALEFEGSLSVFFEFLRSDPQFTPFKSPDEVLDFFRALPAKLSPALESAFERSPHTPFEIRRTESFREKTASAEYHPGSADGSRPGIFYCPIPDATQYNITSGMESLFLHEALPGHHYQISLQQENAELPQFAKFLWYGAYGEGWALYCESIGAELGLYTDPRQAHGSLR